MASQQKIKFFKYHGAGNDFILIEDFNQMFSISMKKKIPMLCDRHFGIGADGVVLLQTSRIAAAKMRIYNSDGGEATMCGNGLRCAIKHFQKSRVCIETNEGISLGENLSDQVAATLPRAEEILSPLALNCGRVGHLMNTGVLHLIVIVDDINIPEFENQARELRYHKMFSPEGVNVSYISRNDDNIFVRTYERGVEAETLACGTACAASVMVIRKYDKKKKSKYKVYPKSGNSLQFTFDNQDRIWMEGPAEKIFQGEIQLLKEEKIKTKMY